MGADPGNADLPDEAEELADLVSPELRDEFLKVMERLTARANEPRTEDEHGNPLPRLDMENSPATTDDPLLRVGYALLANLPERWDSAMLDVEAAADEIRTLVMVYVEDEPIDPTGSHFHFFPDLAEPCLALRRSMYEPGKGAWYHAMIKLYRDGRIHATFHPDLMPPFGAWGPREVELVRRDQELYPRDPENLPPWHPAR